MNQSTGDSNHRLTSVLTFKYLAVLLVISPQDKQYKLTGHIFRSFQPGDPHLINNHLINQVPNQTDHKKATCCAVTYTITEQTRIKQTEC